MNLNTTLILERVEVRARALHYILFIMDNIEENGIDEIAKEI